MAYGFLLVSQMTSNLVSSQQHDFLRGCLIIVLTVATVTRELFKLCRISPLSMLPRLQSGIRRLCHFLRPLAESTVKEESET
jgi:hypothetical protein